jgi:hypothetical protein
MKNPNDKQTFIKIAVEQVKIAVGNSDMPISFHYELTQEI